MRVGVRGWLRACGLMLSLSLLAACAANGPRPESRPSSAPSASPSTSDSGRSDRGNPPFYDVLGKRYHVLATSNGYRERGVASWYGKDFHGLVTSSGEPYDMHAMTAAHTTLPIPTWVEVTNLGNGKQVIVKINDRGPFVDNRLIDLSYAAATALDMVRDGTTRVEVRALAAPAERGRSNAVVATSLPPERATSRETTNPKDPASPTTSKTLMFVQVGAFSDSANAARLVERLRLGGFGNPTVVTETEGRRVLHRVRIGPISDAGEFDSLRGRLRGVGVNDARLVTDR